MIDFRSDTVTLPPPEMRRAMAEAELGDDVFGEDPTVAALEARAAQLLGKDAALFVPSGTMANLLATMTHTQPGDELICSERMHTSSAEGGGAARIAIALDIRPADLARPADTVMFCISKGLAAPIGSLLAGPAAFVHRARRNRKVLGGGMRQAGVIAAAGLYALDHMTDRLADDHANAQRLAKGLRAIGWSTDRDVPDTNIFFVEPPPTVPAQDLVGRLQRGGVQVLLTRGTARTIRLVTHYGIERADIERALEAFATIRGSAARSVYFDETV